jgi:hypothetical protein
MKTKKLTTLKSFRMVTLIMLTISILSSCEQDSHSRYGFDSDFGQNSTGLTMMSIGSNVASIRLSGNIFMDTGEMKVEFVDPDGHIVYTQNFFAPGNYFINETFKAIRGTWKLRYTSIEGTGSIDLHTEF